MTGPSLNTAAMIFTTLKDIRDGTFTPIKLVLPEALDFMQYQVLVWGFRKEQDPIREGKRTVAWVNGPTNCRVKCLVGFGSTKAKAYDMAVKNYGGAK